MLVGLNNTGKEITIEPPPNTTPNWFSTWKNVPDNSMDIIWGQNCPILDPFQLEDFWQIHLNFDKDNIELASFLGPPGSINDIWRDLLGEGRRILKEGGKLIIPYPNRDDKVSDIGQIALIARIINMETIPEFLYKINVIEPLTDDHTHYLKNLFLVNAHNVYRERNGIPVNLQSNYKFLIFEKP